MNHNDESMTGIDRGFTESLNRKREIDREVEEFRRKNVTRDGKQKDWDDVRDDPNWKPAL